MTNEAEMEKLLKKLKATALEHAWPSEREDVEKIFSYISAL